LTEAGRRALVLGGGGIAGIAWEIGLLAGLAEHGVRPVDDAAIIIGTSAGAQVAAQATSGMSLRQLYATWVEGRANSEPSPDVDFAALMLRIRAVVGDERDPTAVRRLIGTLALEVAYLESERRQMIAARLPTHEWPDRPIVLTAIEVSTGELKLFDRTSGVGLVDAVAASSAVPGVWPPVAINGHRYMDGGVRSATNTDLVYDYDRLLVLEALHLPESRDVLRIEDPQRIRVIGPDPDSVAAQGDRPLDPDVGTQCAIAGHRQARAIYASIADFWTLTGVSV
jgi:NTE family protein